MSKHLAAVVFVIIAIPLFLIGCEFSASTANIAAASLAADAEGKNITTEFNAEDTFYAIVALANAPDGTEVKAVWTAVDVGEAAEPNLLLDEATLETGSGQLTFDMANNNLWPAGSYKVDLYLDGELDRTLEFAVQSEGNTAVLEAEPAPADPAAAPQEEVVEPEQETPPAGAVSDLAGVQAATIRIMSQGSFNDPDFGSQLNVPGQGSGFIIDPSGLAVTNNHVVSGAAFIEVFLDGEADARNAKIVGVSECSDLALIDIDGEGLPYLEWYAGDLDVGQDVYAAGFPLFGNEEYTLTRGIISKASAGGDTNWASVDEVLEIDATINGGNSGGPLVTPDGQVAGINYAGNADTRQGFSISRDAALEVIDVLSQGTDLNSIGINGQAVLYEDGTISGIWVSSVASGTPADEVGIEAGDILTQLEGLVLATDGTMADYCDILRGHNDDDVMNIEVLRFATNEVLAGQLNGQPLEQVFSFEDDLGDDMVDVEGYPEYVVVTDDSGTLEVEIPAAWSEVVGTTWVVDGEEMGPSLTAAPNIADFEDSWQTPGLFFAAPQDLVDEVSEAELLDAFDFSDECTFDERVDYADELYTGYYDIWSDCGAEGVLYIILAAAPESRAYQTLLSIQVVNQADLEAVDRIFASFVVKE